MKCLMCPNEIDETREFQNALDPSGKVIEDVMGKWQHQQALGTWTHVQLTAQMGGGSLSVLSGHVCPSHTIKVGSIALVATPTRQTETKTTNSSKGRDQS